MFLPLDIIIENKSQKMSGCVDWSSGRVAFFGWQNAKWDLKIIQFASTFNWGSFHQIGLSFKQVGATKFRAMTIMKNTTARLQIGARHMIFQPILLSPSLAAFFRRSLSPRSFSAWVYSNMYWILSFNESKRKFLCCNKRSKAKESVTIRD